MDFPNVSFQTYVEKRLEGAILFQAQGTVDQFLDCDECDLQMRVRDNRAISIDEHIKGIVHSAVDMLIETDVDTVGLVTFNRDKMIEVAEQIAKRDHMEAFLASCALMLHGYKISPLTHTMLMDNMRGLYTEV